MESAAIVRPATFQTGHFPPDRAHSRIRFAAMDAGVNVLPLDDATRQWQLVATLFIDEPEVAAGLLPFRAMRGDAATAESRVSQQMSEFVTQRAVHFTGTELRKSRVEHDEIFSKPGHPGGGGEPGIPRDADFLRNVVGTGIGEEHGGLLGERGVDLQPARATFPRGFLHRSAKQIEEKLTG